MNVIWVKFNSWMCFYYNGLEKENIMYIVVFGLKWCLIFISVFVFEWICN